MNYVDITTDQLMCFHTKKTKHYLVTLGFQKVTTTKTLTRFFFSETCINTLVSQRQISILITVLDKQALKSTIN